MHINGDKLKSDFKFIKTQLREKLSERIKETHPEPIHIGFMCRQGRHRSIVACRLTIEVLKRKGYKVAKQRMVIAKLMSEWHSVRVEGDANGEGKEFLYEMAVHVWNSLPGY